MKKAQAALEYLMTYGWALIIIVLVLAALFMMGVFNQQVTSNCTGFQKLQYLGHSVSGGKIYLNLGNTTGDDLNTDSLTVKIGNSENPTTTATVTISGDGVSGSTWTKGGRATLTITPPANVNVAGNYTVYITIDVNNTAGTIPYTEKGVCTGSA